MKKQLLAASILFAVTQLDIAHAENADGAGPLGGVAISAGTTIFGTAVSGGENIDGTLWSFDTSTDTFTNLHDFNEVTDGANPFGGVAISGTTVFGTASRGGAKLCSSPFIKCGSIWSFDTRNDTFTNLHDFEEFTDGANSLGGVAVSGTMVFGTASRGGGGTLWSFGTSTDTFTNLHDFRRVADGWRPIGGVAVSGPTVFGTASLGGANGGGAVWSFDTSTDLPCTLEPSTVSWRRMGVAAGGRPSCCGGRAASESLFELDLLHPPSGRVGRGGRQVGEGRRAA